MRPSLSPVSLKLLRKASSIDEIGVVVGRRAECVDGPCGVVIFFRSIRARAPPPRPPPPAASESAARDRQAEGVGE